ncbi:MAG: hypothetical protein KF708_03240 [Pirellulales bacterium]|nr:hypothetical protein [Pirellulales bacterium]
MASTRNTRSRARWWKNVRQSNQLAGPRSPQSKEVERLESRQLLSIGAALVADINPGTAAASPTQAVEMNGWAYFAATRSGTGVELWRTDGTSDGTELVKDIRPGATGSSPAGLVNVNGTLYFTADDGNGVELWKSDGTEAGTVRVKDINPGTASSSPGNLTNVGGTLFFTAIVTTDGANDRELWKSDGTETGTVRVKDINPGTASSSPDNLMNVEGVLFFTAVVTADDGANDLELWKSDGTETGTVLVKDINPGIASSNPSNLTKVGGILYFSANNGTNGTELWKSDGTEDGTVMVKDINPGGGTIFRGLTSFNGKLMFGVERGADGAEALELWSSDGTEDGTVLIRDKLTSASGVTSLGFIPRPSVVIDETLYFAASDGVDGAEGSFQLWKSDGTAAGTTMVTSVQGGVLPGELTNVNGTLFFTDWNSFFTNFNANNNPLWRSDGTAGGTALVSDLTFVRGTLLASQLSNVNGALYFTSRAPAVGSELWRVDGPPAPVGAGGPYLIGEGQRLVLNAAVGGTTGEALFSWDLNGDNIFGDATGATAIVTWDELLALGIQDGPSSYPVTLRVTDDLGTTETQTSLAVANIPPLVSLVGSSTAKIDGEQTFTLVATDSAPEDQAADFTFEIDWDGDGTYDETIVGPSGIQVTRTFTDTTRTIWNVRVRATDRDGDAGPIATHRMTVYDLQQAGDTVTWRGSSGNDAVTITEIGIGAIEVHMSRLGGVGIDLTETFFGVARVVAFGDQGDDVLDASGLREISARLNGGGGSDSLYGGAAADTLLGDDGPDTIFGGAGDDFIQGDGQEGGSRDVLRGGPGNDTIYGDGAEGDRGATTTFSAMRETTCSTAPRATIGSSAAPATTRSSAEIATTRSAATREMIYSAETKIMTR